MNSICKAGTLVRRGMGDWSRFVILFLLIFLLSLGVGCENESPQQTIQARGVVESVEAEQGAITITHDEIPDFMEAMTMEFKVPHPVMLQNIKAGDEVNFTLVQAQDGLYIMAIEPSSKKAD